MKSDANKAAPLGLIAGSGTFPLEVARAAREQGVSVVAVAHRGETDPNLEAIVTDCTWIRVGQLGRMLRALTRAAVKQAAFAGGIHRVGFLNGARLDWAGIKLVARLRSVRDDALLREVIKEIERQGISVIAPEQIAPAVVPQRGLLTRRGLSAAERRDAQLGWDAAQAIGALDIGQSAVAYHGMVIALETVEGTDATIAHAGALLVKQPQTNDGAVVVKICKSVQDHRVDLPACGVRTIEQMAASRCTALILQANKAILIEPSKVISAADQRGIAIFAAADRSDLERP